MPKVRVAFWNVDRDVVGRPVALTGDSYRTIIAAPGYAPPRGSIVLCIPFEAFMPRSMAAIAAIGRVQHQRTAATERVRVRVDPFLFLSRPIDVTRLLNIVHIGVHQSLDEARYRDQFSPLMFSSRQSDMMLDALKRISPEASEYIDRLLSVEPEEDRADMRRLREERDAVETSLRLSNLSALAPRLLLQSRTLVRGYESNTAFGLTFDPGRVIDNEDALIASDLRRFDEDSTLTEIAGSAVRVVDRDLELTVMNVNREELENVHGVDLIYYDHIRDKAVAVQYKRLEWVSSMWVYRRKSDLEAQLQKMANYTSPAVTSAEDLRLSSSPFFFKFVHQDFGPKSSSLLPGMYVPDEYLRLGLGENRFNTGPMDGFQIHEDNTKYITSSTFIELVRRCWIGTTRTDRSALARHAAERAEVCEVILALRRRRVA